jgi:glutamyl-tRNA synthetase
VVEEDTIERIAEKNALLNASKHGGRADVDAVMSKVMGELRDRKPDPKLVYSIVKRIVDKINSLTVEEQENALSSYEHVEKRKEEEEKEKRLPELPGAEKGKVVLRLPPEPSGFMHIGHAMAFSINYIYKKMYDGKLWLRFEDTNPRKVESKYYDSFRNGIRWLGIEYDFEKNVSEDIELIYSYGTKLLESGYAYACSCSSERVKKLRFEGIECEHRVASIDSNLRIWENMLSKKYREGEYVIRLKGDMKNQDYSLRDPNIFRIIEKEHPLTAERFSVWPTYDIANVIEDEVCGVTHVLRSSEFHTTLQNMMRRMLSFREIKITQFSRFDFKGTPVQKRLLRPLVEKGYVEGWDDPRMPTIEGIKRRGIIPQAILRFTQEVGYTKSEHEYDWSLLFAINRKLLDPTAKRLFFVPEPTVLNVRGLRKKVTLKLHPERELGSRAIDVNGKVLVPSEDVRKLEVGEVFRLMELCNVKLISKNNSKEAECEYLGDEILQGTKKVQWVVPDSIPLDVVIPSELFDDKGRFRDDSLTIVKGFVERYFSNINEGEIIQFVRFGFCRVDGKDKVIFAHR